MSFYHDPIITSSEITPKEVYMNRRRFIRYGIGAAVAAAASPLILPGSFSPGTAEAGERIAEYSTTDFMVDEELTPYEEVTSYINFYEFGFDKRSPAAQAQNFTTAPWSIEIAGEVNKPGIYHLEDMLKPHPLEERIYRFRCVEGWSMVIPWIGIPLADIIKRFDPTSKAKYAAFTTLHDPERMPSQKKPSFPWPYKEGLHLDEAMHPLTIMAVGLYGEVLPNQNGAPLRVIVPWKYGFKSIKSIVKIELTEAEPETTWSKLQPQEYGFYANVNPQVDHPRWTQKKERRIGESGMRETLMFNGYEEQVADLYAGMDLRTYF